MMKVAKMDKLNRHFYEIFAQMRRMRDNKVFSMAGKALYSKYGTNCIVHDM